jgi:hypothetical protein
VSNWGIALSLGARTYNYGILGHPNRFLAFGETMNKTLYLFGLAIAFVLGGLAPTLPFVVLAQSGNTDYIHACVKNSNGSLRIEAPGVACANNESALDWAKNADPGSQVPFFCPGCSITSYAGDRLAGRNLANAMLYQANLA